MMALRGFRTAMSAFVVGALLWVGLAGSAAAQPADKGGVQALIEALEAELARGERERLIDPWFLRDLRATIARFAYPWSKRLLEDDFSGPSPTPEPPWRVTAGEWLIDWRFGLRSVVRPPAAREQAAPVRKEEAVKRLFEALIEGAVQKEKEAAPAEPAAPPFAAVIAPLAISNAFALRVELTARPLEGLGAPRLEIGVYQGAEATAGYRLVHAPGTGSPLELVAMGPRGTVSVIEIYDQALALDDGQVHVLEWTRDREGLMVVRVDGSEAMRTPDRRFRDSFAGLLVINAGGDFALRRVVLDGTD